MSARALALFLCMFAAAAHAGGPLMVRNTGAPFLWSTAAPVEYRVDRGMLGTLSETEATTRVNAMFKVWEDVPTAKIRYSNAGNILSVGAFTDGDVSTAVEYNAIVNPDCSPLQSPIIFDTDGTIFDELINDPNVIGFAGPLCTNSSQIVSGQAVMNGRFLDGIKTPTNGELTDSEFDAAFIHEFGHFSGLDHAQINVNCLSACAADDLEGLPTMFPFLVSDQMRTLAEDDKAWISTLYPEDTNTPPTREPFTSKYGTISGIVFFSDGVAHAQGVNVIARRVDDGGTLPNESRRIAVSVVSGFRFTSNLGQPHTADYLPCADTSPGAGCPPSGFLGDNTSGSRFGSRNLAHLGLYEIKVPPGDYTIEVEGIHCAVRCFDEGSSVGPLDPPVALPGDTPEFWNVDETADDNPSLKTNITVTAGANLTNRNIILNNTPPRLDAFEAGGMARLWYPQWPLAAEPRRLA